MPVIYILGLLPALVIIFQLHHRYPKNPKGCRRLGIPPEKSNLHDEYDPKYSKGSSYGSDQQTRIKALFTYPIKSCAGLELDVADVASTGLAYDRQFCFAERVASTHPGDEKTRWDLRTLRDGRFSKLALVRPELWVPDPSAGDYESGLEEVKSQGVMVLYYPRASRGRFSYFLEKLGVYLGFIPPELSFRVPLFPPNDDAYPSIPVKIWKDYPVAYNYGQHIPQSLRDFLTSSPSRPVTLFRVNPSHHRQIFRNAPRKGELGFQPVTGFADAYPIHLLNIASVRDVASRCVDAIPNLSIRRFRPNIVIQGPAAFEEDHWKRIQLRPQSSAQTNDEDGAVRNGVDIHTVCRTVRCRLPNVDPDTGIRHPSEPDRTLKSYRRIDAGCEMFACLGMQLVPAVQEFRLRVNDGLSLLETGEHFYIKMLAPGEKVPGD